MDPGFPGNGKINKKTKKKPLKIVTQSSHFQDDIGKNGLREGQDSSDNPGLNSRTSGACLRGREGNKR